MIIVINLVKQKSLMTLKATLHERIMYNMTSIMNGILNTNFKTT